MSKTEPPRVSLGKVGPDDVRYADLVARGFNRRFSAKPDYVHLVGSADQVVDAVQEAVRRSLRVVARSGGHCLEGFVADPTVRVIIDTSLMTNISYDAEMAAVSVDAGCTLGEMYRKLFLAFGVTVPAGVSPDVGVGGHVLGGGFGYLCRRDGLAADHLHAVEVVVVDETRTARRVVATREPSDPNHDLWWAHTGGGGGNFGIVTKYWFKSRGAVGSEPSQLLPRAPRSVLRFKTEWKWAELDEMAFARLLGNHGRWCEENGRPDSRYTELYSTLVVTRRAFEKVVLTGVVTADSDAERLVDEHIAALDEGIGAASPTEKESTSWLSFCLYPFPELLKTGTGGMALKLKDALLRTRLSERQISVAYRYLSNPEPEGVAGSLGMATYGGKTNVVEPGATASVHRDAIITMSCATAWPDPGAEAESLRWVREFYRDLFADTGGVPLPGTSSDGALINHADVDLADPAWNSSGIPWHAIYYKNNYPRLQSVKARWDPLNVFHHALSIRT